MKRLARFWLVLDAKRSAHIKAAAIVNKSATLEQSREHLGRRAEELKEIMATILEKYDEAEARQQLLAAEVEDGGEELEENKPLPAYETRQFDPETDEFEERVDLTSLFILRATTADSEVCVCCSYCVTWAVRRYCVFIRSCIQSHQSIHWPVFTEKIEC